MQIFGRVEKALCDFGQFSPSTYVYPFSSPFIYNFCEILLVVMRVAFFDQELVKNGASPLELPNSTSLLCCPYIFISEFLIISYFYLFLKMLVFENVTDFQYQMLQGKDRKRGEERRERGEGKEQREGKKKEGGEEGKRDP